MKKIILILFAAVSMIGCYGAEKAGTEIKTMFHGGHQISSFDLSFDEKYLFTAGGSEICVWDLHNRMLIELIPWKTEAIYAHPVDYRLVYIKIDNPTRSESNADYAIYNWKDGNIIGYTSSRGLPGASAKSDYLISKSQNIISFFTHDNPAPVGTIGKLTLNIGSARTNHNDSLLLTSGLLPQIWDLKHARLAGNIAYDRYLYKKPVTTVSELISSPYRRGHKPLTNAYCESYFIPGTDDIIPGTVRDTMTIWTSVDRNRYLPAKEIPVGEGPVFSLSFKGDTIISASRKGLYHSFGGQPFTKRDAFHVASGWDEFDVVTRPYGAGRFLTCSYNNKLRNSAIIIEGSYSSDQPIRVSEKVDNWIEDIKIAPNDKYAVVTYNLKNISKIDLTADSLRFSPSLISNWGANEYVSRCEILPDETIVAGTTAGTLTFWKKDEKESFKSRKAHHSSISSITLSNDSSRMFTTDPTGQITIWNTKTLEPELYLYQMIGSERPGYIILTPDHYYKSTPNAREFINFVKDGQAYDFDQFDLRNNRPDIILSRLGGDAAEIELLNKAWKKRLRRAGINEESLSTDYHVPEVTIVNRNQIPAVSESDIITIEADLCDSKYNLKEVSLTLNGVAVNGNMNFKGKVKKHHMSLPIKLATGNNEIVLTCMNEKGAKSTREIINVIYSPTEHSKAVIYIVAVGVSHYADNRYNLNYANKDACDFAATIGNSLEKRYGHVNKLILTDNEFMIQSKEKIRSFLSTAKRDDVVVMFYAGHGVLDADLDYYLTTSATNFANPADGGILYDDFIGLLGGTEAVSRFCFIDACHSGEIDKEDYLAMSTVEMPQGEELVFRAAGYDVKAREDVEKVNTLLNDMFADIRQGSGATVLSSAGGAELAVESAELKNGLFTYCLKKGLTDAEADKDRNGKISLNELIDYTATAVYKLSEGKQKPVLRSHNYHNDIEI